MHKDADVQIEYFKSAVLNETRRAESKRNAALFISGTGSLSHDALSSKLGGFVPDNYDVIPGPNLDVYATGKPFSPRAMRLIEEGSWESIPTVFNVPQWFYEQTTIIDKGNLDESLQKISQKCQELNASGLYGLIALITHSYGGALTIMNLTMSKADCATEEFSYPTLAIMPPLSAARLAYITHYQFPILKELMKRKMPGILRVCEGMQEAFMRIGANEYLREHRETNESCIRPIKKLEIIISTRDLLFSHPIHHEWLKRELGLTHSFTRLEIIAHKLDVSHWLESRNDIDEVGRVMRDFLYRASNTSLDLEVSGSSLLQRTLE